MALQILNAEALRLGPCEIESIALTFKPTLDRTERERAEIRRQIVVSHPTPKIVRHRLSVVVVAPLEIGVRGAIFGFGHDAANIGTAPGDRRAS